MQQGGDFGSQYYAHAHQYPPAHPNGSPSPKPNDFPPANLIQTAYTSAPHYSHYSPSELPAYSSSSSAAAAAPYPLYSQIPDPIPSAPPSAPSYHQPQSESPASQFSSFTHYRSSLFPSEHISDPSPVPYPHLQQPTSSPYYCQDSHHHEAPLPNPNSDPSHTTNRNPPPHSSVFARYESPYECGVPRLNHLGGYYSEDHTKYGLTAAGAHSQSRPNYDQEKRSETGFQYELSGEQDDGFGDGVYAYDGGITEPYGARGTVPRSSSSSTMGRFDDYGRSTSFSSGSANQVGTAKNIVRAVPKADAQQDVKNGLQKYRVKLLPEGSSVNTMDVICQIGLDGIRLMDPSTNVNLRIYPLESITRWEVLDSSIFCFWSKSSVDIEPKRIRLKSNSYTTNTILDTVTAASVQLKEIGGSRGSNDDGKPSEQPNEKKKGFPDWLNLRKLGNEEEEHWVPDEAVSQCTSCRVSFGSFVRRHHCRNCGDIFCDKCSQGRIALTSDENARAVRVCDGCMAEVTQRLANAKETVLRSTASQNHDDLARKLQEEMERNRKSLSGSKSSISRGKQMREVACPTCTVHLQVQVPTSGSETMECGVCQHPFLVNAH